MRDSAELAALALHRYTGNWEMDSRGVSLEERGVYREAWEREAARQYLLTEKYRRATGRLS